ncbi:MAG: hypothetical protein KKD18_02035 [Nanoarchaeota archaeon]|nr:hypothetical protein [Nanoarchaeota archaeon]
MTNIGIIGRRSKKGDMEFVTAIADSQGTNMESGTKYDSHLKIFTVGDDRNILLLGTGNGRIIVETADALRAQGGIKTVEEASQAVLDITHQGYSKATKGKPEILPRRGLGVDFLIGGPCRNDLGMTRVNTTGFRGDRRHNRYDERGTHTIEVSKGNWNGTFDGSAWGPINRYIEGQVEAGRPIIVETIHDALVEMHDLSLRGARDIGVNDKLHYGIITPGRTVRLVHPDSKFGDTEAYVEQVVSLTGLDVASVLMDLDSSDSERNSAALDLSSRIGILTGGFYYALVSELGESSNLKQEYTGLSERIFRDAECNSRFEEIRRRRLNSLARVQEGVGALLSRDPQKMRDYMTAAGERRKTELDRLFGEYVAPKQD